MKRIFKYGLKIVDRQSLILPRDFEPLCVQMQHGQPHLWAVVDDAVDTGMYVFVCCGTGHTMPDMPMKYLGTVQVDGVLVFHYFLANAR